jgi:hypothetical protein
VQDSYVSMRKRSECKHRLLNNVHLTQRAVGVDSSMHASLLLQLKHQPPLLGHNHNQHNPVFAAPAIIGAAQLARMLPLLAACCGHCILLLLLAAATAYCCCCLLLLLLRT